MEKQSAGHERTIAVKQWGCKYASSFSQALARERRPGHRGICSHAGRNSGACRGHYSSHRLERQQCFFKCCQFDPMTRPFAL